MKQTQKQPTGRGVANTTAVQVFIPPALNAAWTQLAALRGCSKADVLSDLIPSALDAQLIRVMRERELVLHETAQ